jgi:HEPN domain-containing protein
MRNELLSKQLRDDFREVLTTFVLREIESIFEAGGLTPNEQFIPNVGGQRRSLVEQYYANIDFSNRNDVVNLLRAYEELLFRLGPRTETDESAVEHVTRLKRRIDHDGLKMQNGRFVLDSLPQSTIDFPKALALSSESIAEHIEKARTKIAERDCSGAITNAYTLVEEFLKEILRQTHTEFKESEGDIRSLYATVSERLNLNPKGENLEGHLRTILQGLKSIIAGLYDVANKASDRHARKYNPAEHHAKLAVSAAMAVCEFILDSYEYQQRLETRRAL